MPKKEDWQQYSFVAPVHVDIGMRPKKKHPRPKPRENSDLTAVWAFKKAETAYTYRETFTDQPPPDINQLSLHQQLIYRAIKAGEEQKAEAQKQQWEARKWGLTGEIFYLDQVVELEQDSGCGHCASHWIRQAVVQQVGRNKHAGQTQLLINDHCSCANVDKTFKVWVPDSQIIRKE